MIKLKRRSYLGVVLRLPVVFRTHYKMLRAGGNSRIEAARVAVFLTKSLLTLRRKTSDPVAIVAADLCAAQTRAACYAAAAARSVAEQLEGR